MAASVREVVGRLLPRNVSALLPQQISHAQCADDTQRAVTCNKNVGQSTLSWLTRETQTLATLIALEQSDRLQATGGWNSLTCNPPPFRVKTFYSTLGTHVSNKDRDFRPARRRAFADDNYEALWSNFGSVPEFGAQRFEAPAAPPAQAVVKWYNPDKGFGFVQLADGSGDAFLHASVVERSGHDSVPAGATLEIRAGSGAKGPQVTEILSIDTSTASQEPPRRGRPERPIYPSDNQAAVEEIGTVKWYNAMKGFGFIASDRGGKDIFVHATVLNRAGIADLPEGQRVAVDVVDGRKGPEAASIRLI
jgi:cold shock protein